MAIESYPLAARNHHYLSQCYLRGFTSGNSKNSKLLVFDFKQNKHFETKPRNVGSLRDFNRIDIEGFDPNHVENEIAKFEDEAATALKRVDEGQPFEGSNKEVILNLVAMLASRSPERRETWRQFHETVAERMMDLTLESKERWENQIKQMKDSGKAVDETVSYEQMKKFVQSKNYTIEVRREHHLRMELVAIETILPLLMHRGWHTLRTNPETDPFVTTDNPVILLWTNPDDVPGYRKTSPGYGLKNTQVIFAVSSSVLIIGEFEQDDVTSYADKKLVANMNSIIMNYMKKQTYAPRLSFSFIDTDGHIKDGKEIIKFLSNRRVII